MVFGQRKFLKKTVIMLGLNGYRNKFLIYLKQSYGRQSGLKISTAKN